MYRRPCLPLFSFLIGTGLLTINLPAPALTFTPTDPNDSTEILSSLLATNAGINYISGSYDYLGSPLSTSRYNDLNLGQIGSTQITLPDGILLTSGYAYPATSNTSSSYSSIASNTGEAGLDTLAANAGLPQTTTDASAISFSFTVAPGVNAISLNFMYASEEFPDQGVTDIAGVFVDGTSYAHFADGNPLAFISGSPSVVNFFDNGNGSPGPLSIEYDGVTRPLTMVGLLDPNLTVHTIKIAVSDTSDNIYDSGLFVANLHGVTLASGSGGESTGYGTTPADPLLPDSGDDPQDGFDFSISIGDTGFGISPTLPVFIDPDIAIGYEYTTSGPNFAGVLLPNIGDNLYDLYYWDGFTYQQYISQLSGGTFFDFLTIDPTGLSKFKILGIELSAGLDPTDPAAFVTGLTFVSGGSFNVNQLPITVSTNVTDIPEPDAWMMLSLGCALLLIAGKHRPTIAMRQP